MATDCEHNWQFQQTVFWFGHERPGSSARDMHLGDRYFCTKCLDSRIANERIHGTSYDKRIEGTVPK